MRYTRRLLGLRYPLDGCRGSGCIPMTHRRMHGATALDHEIFDGDPLVELEISDVLDLHPFAPREIPALVRDYLDECATRGFTSVRLIHGKGIGNLRRTVHAILERHPSVRSYRLADESAGGWGATLVELRSLAGDAG